jgi:hypothetical protein
MKSMHTRIQRLEVLTEQHERPSLAEAILAARECARRGDFEPIPMSSEVAQTKLGQRILAARQRAGGGR